MSSGGTLMLQIKKMLLLAASLGLLLAASTARAEDGAGPNDKVVYKKKTIIDLTGATIEGELTKPEGSYIVNRKVSRFSSLITLRENFIPELLASPDQI